jgi:hypothetical protein
MGLTGFGTFLGICSLETVDNTGIRPIKSTCGNHCALVLYEQLNALDRGSTSLGNSGCGASGQEVNCEN